MLDPQNLPRLSHQLFVLVNSLTGHIRKRSRMTAETAVRLNSQNHLLYTGYQWMLSDQLTLNVPLFEDLDPSPEFR